MDGKARQTSDITLRNALARELTDDDLAAIAVGASAERHEVHDEPQDPQPDSSKLN